MKPPHTRSKNVIMYYNYYILDIYAEIRFVGILTSTI